MRFNLIILFFTVVIGGFVRANNHAFLDSINNLSYDLSGTYPDSALQLAHKAYNLAAKQNDIHNQIVALYRMGWVHYKLGDFKQAMNQFNQGENLFEKAGKDSIYLAKVFVYQAMTTRKMGNVNKALEKYGKATVIAFRKKDDVLLSDCVNNICDLLIAQGKYEPALYLLNAVLEKLDEHNFRSRGMIHQTFGNIYYHQKRFREGLSAYQLSADYLSTNPYAVSKVFTAIGNTYLSLEMNDSALYYYNRAFVIANKKGYVSLLDAIKQNKGEIFFQQNNYDSALVYFEKTLTSQQFNENVLAQGLTYERLGDIFRIKKRQNQALYYYKKSFKIAQASSDNTDLKDLSYNLGTLYADLGNLDSATYYFNITKCYQDSLASSISKSLIYELHYEEEKHKVEALQLRLKNNELMLKKRTNLIWFISFIALFIIFLLFVFVRYYQQKRKAIEIEKENIEKEKKLNDLINLQEQEALKAMFTGQEKEKNRIATELHDRLGAILSTVKLYFKSIDKQINHLKEENIKQYHKANELLDEACEETRKIAHQLSSSSLGRKGLFETVRRFQDQINGAGEVLFELITHGSDEKLGQLNQTSIYRIIQELVNNSLKHAAALEISLQLNVLDQVFNLIIEDDGVGFDFNRMIDNSGIGLKEIESRVKTMSGSMSIDSGKGAGTTITIDIPLTNE